MMRPESRRQHPPYDCQNTAATPDASPENRWWSESPPWHSPQPSERRKHGELRRDHRRATSYWTCRAALAAEYSTTVRTFPWAFVGSSEAWFARISVRNIPRKSKTTSCFAGGGRWFAAASATGPPPLPSWGGAWIRNGPWWEILASLCRDGEAIVMAIWGGTREIPRYRHVNQSALIKTGDIIYNEEWNLLTLFLCRIIEAFLCTSANAALLVQLLQVFAIYWTIDLIPLSAPVRYSWKLSLRAVLYKFLSLLNMIK